MPDLLLTHGYFLFDDPKELQIMKPYPPLGILYLCSHLRQKGFNVDVFDTTFSTRDLLFRHLAFGNAFGAGYLFQPDDSQERHRHSSCSSPGGMEDGCGRP